MDSLTQIILGAACGEAVLGNKIGNKAIVFGAIGGTIPDLDVFVGRWIYNNEIDAMLFHRGFMHSILFSILGAFLLGWLVHKLYNNGVRLHTTTKNDWIKLFFWSLFTHPILDCFTPYGTQLFYPFLDYRVAFNNISVVDLTYTIPFLLCMLILLFFKRNTRRRRLWLKLGLGISSIYMLFTIGNKFYIDSVFKKSLQSAGIDYARYSTQPTILNTILWYGIAEAEANYFVGFYSLLDSSNKVEKFLKIPKNHNLIDITHSDITQLIWFSNGYFNFEKKDKGLKYIDLRYPLLNDNNPNSSVFSFDVIKENNRWAIKPFEGKPPKRDDFKQFIERIKGK